MRCCLIVATIGRVEPLDRLLHSLAVQVHRAFRVVLVDQNGDDRLATLVARHAPALAIEHLRIPASGVSAARNAGLLRLGDAELVAFPDDDCHYDPLTLANAVAVFAARPEAGAVMGSLHLPQDVEVIAGAAVDGRSGARVGRTGLLRASNTFTLFFRRPVVDLVGGFDPTFGPGTGSPWLCGEDSDYLIRAHDSGSVVVRAPQIRLYHPAVDGSGPGYAAKAFGYGRGRIRLLRKHRFPWWFRFANLVHPLLALLWSGPAVRRFRWHLFRGRLHEWIHGASDGAANMADLRCPACGSRRCSDVGAVFHPRPATVAGVPIAIDDVPFRLIRCAACGLRSKTPGIGQDQLSACYAASADAIWPQPDPGWAAALVALVQHYAPGRRILDVGCFNGGVLRAFGDGWQRAGIEPSAAAAATATACGIEIIGATLADPDPAGRRFDAILLLNVIEHVPDPRVLLGQLVTRLRPDGILVIMTGDAGTWPWRLSGSQYWYCSLVEHVTFLDRASLAGLAHAAGLGIVEYRNIRAGVMPPHRRLIEGTRFLLWSGLRALHGFGHPHLNRLARRHRSPMCQAFPDHMLAVLRQTERSR